MKSRATAATLLVLGVLLAPALGHADEASAARAQALFDKGLAAARQGDFVRACPLFRASQEAEPRTGTLLNLGTCYEKNWQTASAWAAYREAEASARREGRADWQEQAKQKWTQLEPRLVRLTVQVPASSRIPGLIVLRDGVAMQPAEYDTALPVDPGEHVLSAQAPNHVTWEEKIIVTNRSRETRVPTLQRGKDAPPSWWTTGRKVGVGVGATGVAAMLTGSVLALYANSKYQIAQNSCRVDGNRECNPGSSTDEKSARNLMVPASIFFVSGAVLAAGGGALVLFSKPKQKTPSHGALQPSRVALDLGAGFVGVSGQFE